MEASIIKIGNSKGLRLSKTILEKYNIKDKVELILEKGQIILRPIASPRKNWEKEFKKMREDLATKDFSISVPDMSTGIKNLSGF